MRRLVVPPSVVSERRIRGADASEVGHRVGTPWPEELVIDGRVYESRRPLRDAWGEFAGQVYVNSDGEEFELYND